MDDQAPTPAGKPLSAEAYIADNMHHLAKLEAVGQLASGIAHDFNNVLSCIIGFAELSLRELPEDNESRQYIRLLIEKASGASEFVHQLLSFTSDDTQTAEPVDINAAIRSTLHFMQRYLGEHITISQELSASLPPISSSATVVNQILMNLCINARDAMPEGGDLTIISRRASANGAQDDPSVEVVIRDSGIGIPGTILPNIFNPFYTTKSPGEGTGLGLFIVKSLVEKFDGKIFCSSKIGEGTTFRLQFPITEFAREKEADNSLPLRGSGTILVAEDDDDFRKIVAEALRENGYEVLVARNGKQALDAILNYPRTVDLVIADLFMPEMGGLELCQYFSDEEELRFLLMSGHNEGISTSFPFIKKPFYVIDLLRAVQRLLNEAKAAARVR